MISEWLVRGDERKIAVKVTEDGPAVSYEQLRSQVDRWSAWLRSLGLQPEDRIAIALPNGLEMIVAFLSAATAGTAAPLNPGYKLDEFRFFLSDTRARALIVPRRGGSEACRAAEGLALIIEAGVEPDGEVQFASAGPLQNSRGDATSSTGSIALLLHTSGTTSRPKRVPLTHANLVASARNVAATYRLGPEDTSLCVMPLFHVHGLVASTLATLLTGGTVAVVPRFNPLSFWPTVREQHATWYSAVPTIHRLLLARSKPGERPRGAEGLRFIRSCSSPLAPRIMEEMEHRFEIPVIEAYGMTEAAHQMASNPLPPGTRKPGSVGRQTGLEMTILDDHGNRLPSLVRGEVAIRGTNVFGGYEGNPLANAESFVDGWFRTGDEGFLGEDGYLTLVGRIKELINRGGEKVSPREIDDALLAHPAVAEAVCFGVPDRIYGEEVAAAVVLRSPVTEKELINHCRTLLADFKCPRVIHILESMPRTVTGKIQRRLVAKQIRG
ncbi:MAG: AMP-binding protein [Acidobacteria bacterium]|nr:AMP-binding protein [Acidobacteriota bacterium]